MKQNYALKIAYEGTEFFGWQKTRHGPSIEETLQTCLECILQEQIVLQAASRTDRGVHAEGQLINFFSEKIFSPDKLLSGLNALLPTSIRALSLSLVPISFHPTLHAEKKEYHYQISLGPIQLPKDRHFAWHVPYRLDFEKMHRGALFFLGEHDFSCFCTNRKNLNYTHKRRLITEIDIISLNPSNLLFTVQGNHFLYKMVRTLVGTLVYIGRGKILSENIPSILEKGLRSLAGMTAPAHGLTLKRVYYPQEFRLEV
jgi:tRNA pseudouridine38-40 synthase